MDPLEDYWQGEFVLQEPGAGERRPGGRGGAAPRGGDAPELPIDRLAPPEITVRGRNLAALLAPAYRAMTS